MGIKKIQLRRDVPENWSLNNPVLSEGEIGVELSQSPAKIKIGDGEKNWNDLDYFGEIGNSFQEITYSELKNLRDSGKLVPGNLYRITDYVTTTVQSGTKSAGHPFDIIVLATSESELSHLARAIAHEGDTYFDGNDLGAWELWYDLDNDMEKYEWADAENGKGVIYRMIDKKRNDCPYDFKNILFYNAKYTSGTTSDKYYYTFSYVVSGVLYDGTVEKQVTNCYGNSMGVYISNKKRLNINVWRNTSFEYSCHSNTFGRNCHNNSFGRYCYSNTFGRNCHNNTFGDDCRDNSFVSDCYSNFFIDSCHSNTFGRHCYSNSFGRYCYSNTFGRNCHNNTFGDDCRDNSFASDCQFNTFGDNCINNTFGSGLSRHKVDHSKTSITLNDEYYDDGSGQLVPVKHPDLSTQPSILPYKFMGQHVYEQLISTTDNILDRIVSAKLEVESPFFLSAFGCASAVIRPIGVFGYDHAEKRILFTEDISDYTYIRLVYTTAIEGQGDGYGTESQTSIPKSIFNVASNHPNENGNRICIWAFRDKTLYLLKSDGTYHFNGWKNEPIPEEIQESIEELIIEDSKIKPKYFGTGTRDTANRPIEWNYPNLKRVIFPEEYEITQLDAFERGRSITSVRWPKFIKEIGQRVFARTGLKSVSIPISVEKIGLLPFSGLQSISVAKSNAVFDSRNNCNAIIETSTNKLILGSTKTIIPTTVVEIGTYAFAECSFDLFKIPSSVTTIGRSIFNQKESGSEPASVLSIRCEAVIPPSLVRSSIDYQFSFYGIDSSIPVYVPAESVDAYKAHSGWSYFTNIQAITE